MGIHMYKSWFEATKLKMPLHFKFVSILFSETLEHDIKMCFS
jgi:hypothetical protein